jgi:hypothetical protein
VLYDFIHKLSMTELNITPEFLDDINEIIESYFYNRRYKLDASFSLNSLNIEACGYYIEKYDLTSKDINNPERSDDFYRDKSLDFRILYEGTESDGDTLTILGYWRTEILSYYYTPEKTRWVDMSLEELSTPCSDGKDFELMAPRLYDCVQSYFKDEIKAGLFAYSKELEYLSDNSDSEEKDPELELLNHRITDLFLEHRMLELYRLSPHPRYQKRIKFLELTTSGKPLTDDEWVEAELLWVDFCQSRGNEVTPLDRQKIIDSWDKE